MKKLIIIFAFVVPGFCIAQKVKIEVPEVVKATFKEKITDSVAVKWEKEKDYYEASFIKSDLKGEVEIKENGEWIKTSWDVPIENIPAKIKEHILKNFAGYKVKESEIEYKADGNFYVIEIKMKKDEQSLLFNISGEFVSSTKKEVK